MGLIPVMLIQRRVLAPSGVLDYGLCGHVLLTWLRIDQERLLGVGRVNG